MWVRGLCLVLVVLRVGLVAWGQARANEPGGELPLPRGLNGSLTAAVQHDSANGWTSLLLPDVLWRWTGSLSVDAVLPVFTSITTEVNTGTRRKPEYTLESKHHAVGDLLVNGVYERRAGAWETSTTASLGLPTGRTEYGLGAGKVTYALSQRAGYSLGSVSPDVELGVGNSSVVLGTGPTLPYVANAAFVYGQAGATAELPAGMDVRAEAFELLPLSKATVYSTARRGKLATQDDEAEGGSGEDNGVNVSVGAPVAAHWAVSAFYTRSLVNHYDIGGFAVTYTLRPHARKSRF